MGCHRLPNKHCAMFGKHLQYICLLGLVSGGFGQTSLRGTVQDSASSRLFGLVNGSLGQTSLTETVQNLRNDTAGCIPATKRGFEKCERGSLELTACSERHEPMCTVLKQCDIGN